MPVLNVGNILSSLFTWLKLGVSLALLVVLTTKLIDIWQETSQTPAQTSEGHNRLPRKSIDLLNPWK
ncbi:hypothetical protein N836_29895 [Leptolyngbya sp. Heron Island J]|uniref:hypothetical protein n=1 Tax=Leptolyngbya sp. Heron Island J TaxID=1385935 RepID=UPI0003B99139|nr:hypothetical protein [Leptolyngbya sp. Heron Island J]ESA38916.1 hypothetical protein N836_29895 [Leptolyngbya sp. Heron Island J]